MQFFELVFQERYTRFSVTAIILVTGIEERSACHSNTVQKVHFLEALGIIASKRNGLEIVPLADEMGCPNTLKQA